jgi:putative DNA primase/helicase
MPDADVLMVDGEKTADAARKLFPQSLVLSWYGGPHAIDSADWTPLQRYRHITLRADNDDEGKKAMQQIEATLARLAQRGSHPASPMTSGSSRRNADRRTSTAASAQGFCESAGETVHPRGETLR